jgi:AraC-like DNA-binding protein
VPHSIVRRFVDPDEYTASVRGSRADISITKPGRFAATLIRIDLHRLWMQRFSETLPRVVHFDQPAGRAYIAFATCPSPNLLYDGKERSPTTIIRFRDGHSGFQRSIGPTHFAAMSLPIADAEALGATYGGYDLTPPRNSMILDPALSALQRLRKLHEAAGHLAEHAPHVIAEPEAARGLEQALIAAWADCLNTTGIGPLGGTSGQHALVMKRFRALLEEHADQIFHIPEICRMIGVSSRTLTTCCNEALGMGPLRYLRVRQLNFTRRALTLADPATSSVTEIATAHGFWELGRFAVAYRALFGERPSTTLQRAAGNHENSAEPAGLLPIASLFA